MFIEILSDVVLALVIFFGAVIGYKKGFVKSVFGPVRFCLSLLTAIRLVDPISKNLLEPTLKTPVTNQIKGYLIENCPGITPESASEELPTMLKFAASLLDVDVSSLSGENTIAAIVDSLASPIVHFLSVIITFIAVYFIAKLAYSLLLSIVAAFFDSAVLSLPNKLLGAVFGVFIAMITAWILTVLFELLIHSAMLSDAVWAQNFEGGRIYGFFNKHNPIDILLGF